jgi:O-antigen/teichoic acid export membrane protein
MLSRQARNFIANHAGAGTRLVLLLAFNVAYFRLLGSEGYGLVGLYAIFAAVTPLLDLGIGQAGMREVARRAAIGSGPASCAPWC